MAKNFKNYINGQWVDSVSGEVFENINPSNIYEVLGYFPRSTKDDVDKAVSAALEAFNDWRHTPAPQRAEILYEAARIMSARREYLAKVISNENGKTVKSSLGEVQSAIDMANFIAGEGRRMYGKTTHSGLRKRFAMTKRYPIGVIGIILPFNFPLALASWRVFPALICGNVVVLKSDENSPETLVHFAEILKEAGLSKGVFNLIHGFGAEVGEPLTLHTDVSMISFTGSSAVGKIVAKNCINRHAKVSLELGGKNAVIIMDDADLSLAVDAVVCGAFSVSGQRCTATSRVIVHNAVHDEFMKRLLERSKALKIGPAYEDASDVTPLINKKQLDRILGFIERAKKDGAAILIGGEQLRGSTDDNRYYDSGYYVAPTIIDNVTADMEIAKEEIFGPVLVVLKANSYDEALAIHNSSPYGLSASLFTRDINKAMSFFDDAEAGVCYINAPTFGSEPHMPFGGMKHSGRGYREVGWAAIDAYSETKTLYIDYSATIQNVQFVDKSGKE